MFPNASGALSSICGIKRIDSQRDNLNRSERVSATFFHAMCHSAAAMLPGEKYTGGEIQIYLVTSSNKKGKNSALFVNYKWYTLQQILVLITWEAHANVYTTTMF